MLASHQGLCTVQHLRDLCGSLTHSDLFPVILFLGVLSWSLLLLFIMKGQGQLLFFFSPGTSLLGPLPNITPSSYADSYLALTRLLGNTSSLRANQAPTWSQTILAIFSQTDPWPSRHFPDTATTNVNHKMVPVLVKVYTQSLPSTLNHSWNFHKQA